MRLMYGHQQGFLLLHDLRSGAHWVPAEDAEGKPSDSDGALRQQTEEIGEEEGGTRVGERCFYVICCYRMTSSIVHES